MVSDRKQFNRVVGDDVLRFPRLGKIKLGIKLDTGGMKETDYFVCPVEVQNVFGEQPKELKVMFPVNDDAVAYREAYKWYGAGSIKCYGNGDTAMRRVDCLTPDQKKQLGDTIKDAKQHDMVEIDECPCPLLDSRACRLVGSLYVMLPDVSLGGVYQIDVHSLYGVKNIKAALALTRAVTRIVFPPDGSIAGIEHVLTRVPTSIQDPSKGVKRTHHIIMLRHTLTADRLKEMMKNKPAQLAGPASTTSRVNPGPLPVDFSEEPGETGQVEEVPESERIHPVDVFLNIITSHKDSLGQVDYYEATGSDNDGEQWAFRTKDKNVAKKIYERIPKKVWSKVAYNIADGVNWITSTEDVEF